MLPHPADAFEWTFNIPIRIGHSELWFAMMCLAIVIWFHLPPLRRKIAAKLVDVASWISPGAASDEPIGATPSTLRFYVSPSGVCVHTDKDCRGLRNVSQTNKRSLRPCLLCGPNVETTDRQD